MKNRTDTSGGAHVGRDVGTEGGDFVGRDKIIFNISVERTIWVVIIIIVGLISTALINGSLSSLSSPSLYQTPSFNSVGNRELTDNSLSNYDLILVWRFQPGSWSVGKHKYTLEFHCSDGTEDVVRTHTFTVSDSARRQGSVFLQLGNVYGSQDNPIDSFHPEDYSEARITFTNLTEFEAKRKNQSCKSFVRFDNEGPYKLEGSIGIVYQALPIVTITDTSSVIHVYITFPSTPKP